MMDALKPLSITFGFGMPPHYVNQFGMLHPPYLKFSAALPDSRRSSSPVPD
jgi:hypothetical protein